MLHFQLPLSMPSILSSNQYTSLALLPSPQTYAEYFKICQRQKDNSSWGSGGRPVSGVASGAAPLVHGLRTPPKEMMAASFNPLYAPGSQYSGVPPSIPSVTSYRSTAGTFSNANTFPTGVHNSNGQPNFKSTSRPQSPRAHRDNTTNQEQQSRKRSTSNGNAIVHYLQIPASINDSKGSLAEFAAQITCLFWFESSLALHRVEESKNTPMPTTPLVSEALPSMGFRKWVTTILSTTQVTQNVILLALLLIYRLKKLNPTVKGKPGSEFRLLTVALMLGNKFLDDNTYTNKTWAEVSGISVQEIHIMEVEFLSNMKYNLYTSDLEWREWHVKLGRFWNYFDRASKTQVDLPPRAVLPPTPMFNLPPSLPSPPASTNASPPFLPSHHTSTSNPTYPHPLSMPPYLAPTIPSPAPPMPEIDLRPAARKRSYDDNSQEPPAKRHSQTMAPSAASSTTLTPSTLYGITPNVPRLPMPNLSINTSKYVGGADGLHSGQLPPPGRAMSMVYPGLGNWLQSGTISSSQKPTPLYPHTNIISSTGEPSRRQSPFPGASGNSSPISSNFPQSQHSQSLPSPSYFSTHRNSPYRPVRGVNTLLVPPPSASMHKAPQNLGFDQMHYQPLGKPLSERKTGVVPYMHHDAWPQLQMPQWPSLPQPNMQN